MVGGARRRGVCRHNRCQPESLPAPYNSRNQKDQPSVESKAGKSLTVYCDCGLITGVANFPLTEVKPCCV
jgi:hypothetical protein